jgi:hypothetical protein
MRLFQLGQAPEQDRKVSFPLPRDNPGKLPIAQSRLVLHPDSDIHEFLRCADWPEREVRIDRSVHCDLAF